MWDLIVSVPDHCLSFYFVCFLLVFDFLLMLFRTVWWLSVGKSCPPGFPLVLLY